MPDGETRPGVTELANEGAGAPHEDRPEDRPEGQSDAGPAAVALRSIRAVRFGPVIALTIGYALLKKGCRGLHVTPPLGGQTATFSWTSKAGGTFTIGPIPAEETDVVRRWIYPDAVVLALLDASDLPQMGALELSGQDAGGAQIFTVCVPYAPHPLLLGSPLALRLALARLPEAPLPQLSLDGQQAELQPRSAASPEQRFEIWEAVLPKRFYDGESHRIELYAPGQDGSAELLIKKSWVAPEMFCLAQIAPKIVERPRLDAIPPADVTLALDHLEAGWLHASQPQHGALTLAQVRAALAQRRVPGTEQVALYLFAPTLEAALATPALAQLAEAHGAALRPHIVLPSPEAITFYSSVQTRDRVEQMLPLITPSHVPERIRTGDPSAAVVILPAGAELEPEADTLLAEVRQGRSFGRLARLTRQVSLGGEVQLRIAERPDLAGLPPEVELEPGRPGEVAAIVSQRTALRLLSRRRPRYGGLEMPVLELTGPEEGAFAKQTLNSGFVSVPEIPILLVMQGLPSEDVGQDRLEVLIHLLATLSKEGVQVLHACLYADHKALPEDSPLRRKISGVERVFAASEAELGAFRQVGDLMPDHKGSAFFTTDQMLHLAGALDPPRLAQALRLAVAATALCADLRFDLGQDPGQDPGGEGTTLRALCTAHRARLAT